MHLLYPDVVLPYSEFRRSGLIQRGEETDGIIGFLPDDIQSELQRGAKLRCAFCKEIYATVGCCQKLCSKSYHLPCGIKYGALSEYYGNFDSYCPMHRARRMAKVRPRNYVLTDMGLIPEQVDADTNFDEEKYRVKLRKLEKDLGKREKPVMKKEKIPEKSKVKSSVNSNSRERKVDRDRVEEGSSDEDVPVAVSRKKKVMVKKEPVDNHDTGRRSGRRIIKKKPGGDIYSSAVDELKKLLAKKQEIRLDETYSDLAGTRRKVAVKKEKEESDDDVNWVKPRASTSKRFSRTAKEHSVDSEDEVEHRRTDKFNAKKKVVKRKKHDNGEESVESIKIFLQTTKRNKVKDKRKSVTDSSDEELPYPKIRKKTSKKTVATPLKKGPTRDSSSELEQRKEKQVDPSVNADMESMMDENESECVSVDINELINNLSDEEVPLSSKPGPKSRKLSLQGSNKRRVSKHFESESDFEEGQQLPDSSDFEITSQESEEEEIQKPKKLKGVSFSEEVEEFPCIRKQSKSFKMDELLKKDEKKKAKPAKRSLKKKKEENIVVEPDLFNNQSDTEYNDEQNDENYPAPDASSKTVEERTGYKDEIRTTIYFENSSDEEEPPPSQNVTTDADFDQLFSEEESESHKVHAEKKSSQEYDNKLINSDKNTPGQTNSTDMDSDILNKALEETGIFSREMVDETEEKDSNKEADGICHNPVLNIESDPFSASPFKLLFSTFGGGSESGQLLEASENASISSNNETENLSTTLDPDEFLQNHFK